MIKKEKLTLLQRFPMDSFSGGCKCLHSISQKRAILHSSSKVNYRLFAHSDVLYRFNLENDDIVLEY